MHKAQIQAALKLAEHTQAQVAELCQVSTATVSDVISGKKRNPDVEARISEITEIPLYRLWPQWHDAPKGAPKDFDPMELNVGLLEAVERNLASALMERIPGLVPPFSVRARHRVAVYNACVKRGMIAIETGAGTAHEVARFLAQWAENYEQTTGEKPTPEALRKWALAESSPEARARASTQVIASGGSIASGRDTNFGNVTKPRRR